MNISESILTRLEENEQITQKFHELETGILTILDFQDFFEHLLTRISQIFEVPHVWISIIKERAIYNHINDMTNSSVIQSNTAFLQEKDFYRITGKQNKTLLINQGIENFRALFPSHSPFSIQSMSVTPVSLDGDIIGSLNQGDINEQRFSPGMDTVLLERLALKISLCLSNVAAHEKLQFLAYHDPLTALLNRRVMENILEREFLRSQRYLTDLLLIFLDLDNFKAINDEYGHDYGDKALVHFAAALAGLKRHTDIAARFAGDEFVIILPSTGSDNGETFITRLTDFLDTTPVTKDHPSFFIKFSFGIASALEKEVKSPSDLLKLADKRLYRNKKNKS